MVRSPIMDPGDEGDNASLVRPESVPAPAAPASPSLQSGIAGVIPSIGGLLKRVGDSTQNSPDGIDEDDDPPAVLPSPPAASSHHPITMVNGSSSPPFFVLSFSEISYSVKVRRHSDGGRNEGRMKVLLNSVSGQAREGQILAVLGPSGSGKTTLIDALAGRISRGSLHGQVALNGEDLYHHRGHLLKVISAYVMQHDLLYPMLTVEETLNFAAEFHLPRSVPRSRKRERVKTLIDQLGLQDVAGTIIGNESRRGISGGERRRVSIGADILHDPILLFLDEPISGLDSTSAYQVVKVLKEIALTGSVLVMAVHQPSARILGLLDRLLFLSRGCTVYSGSPDGLFDFFAGFGRPIPAKESRTEFAIDLILELEGSPDGTEALAEHHRRWQEMHERDFAVSSDTFADFTLWDAISASISRGKLMTSAAEVINTRRDASRGSSTRVPTFANPVWMEVKVLMKRALINSWRRPELFAGWLGTALTTSLVLAEIFWRLPHSVAGIQERVGFFAMAVAITFFACGMVLQTLIDDRYIFIRETAHNAYRCSSYVLANTMAEIPSLFPLSITFATITYFAVGLSGGFSGFLFYLVVIFTCFWAGTSYVTFLSIFMRNLQMGALALLLLTLASFLIVSGFLVTRDRIPIYWQWLHYASLMKYPYEAVMHNEFDDPHRCFVRGDRIFDQVPLLASISPEMKTVVLEGLEAILRRPMRADTCVVNGPYVLETQAMTQLGKWTCLWILLASGFLFRLLFYISLRVHSKNKRR